MASEFAKAIPKAARTRALRYFVGGTAGAVGLGCGGTYAAYRYFLNFEQLRREEAARGGKPAPKPAGLAGGPSMWPIVAGASTCFSVGALGGLAMSAKGGTKKVASSEGAVLGAQAFVIATGLVAGLGVAIVYTIRGALGVTTIREFGELVRGGPMVLDDDGWDGADSRHDFVDGRLRLDSGLEIMYDLLHYNGTLGAEQQEGAAAAAAQPKLLTGPQPVVLLHGLNGNRATMRDVIAPSLTEAGHAVLLMDQRGATGGTTTTRGQRKVWWRWQPGSAGNAADTEGVSVKVLADDTLKLMDKLHLPAVHLVGCAIGGLIAEELARTHPDRVLSITCAALDSAGSADAEAISAGEDDDSGGSFCPVDAKLPEHWNAARAAACTAYTPATAAPKCPVTLVLPPGSNPAIELKRLHTARHVTARVVRAAPLKPTTTDGGGKDKTLTIDEMATLAEVGSLNCRLDKLLATSHSEHHTA